ncbi:filamentous haemagglutinin family protein [Variovorax sp. LT1R16]|uniref:filamentous haemagglutinin family protein n=1 Tax=Variovorax sp. LT1R16 TaxID=3443728 RepID=UPI003F48B0EF
MTASWLNANPATQVVANGRTTVNIQQTADKAILNWETFNVGKNTTVSFQQLKNWSVLNRVTDPLARPSQIAGQIQAPGSVYILNRNGILFHGSSQVNVGSLVASAVNITNDKFKTNFLSTAWDATGPTFAAELGLGAAGLVAVEAGARLQSASGGRLALFGGDVRNEGTLSAPDGQVLLAAGQQIYLRASDDNGMRGLHVRLGEGGLAYTAGLIDTPRGNVTLTGAEVVVDALAGQADKPASAVLAASTSLIANGSITLAAADRAQAATVSSEDGTFKSWEASSLGSVTVAPGAVLQILPELSDTTRAASDKLDDPSAISLRGSRVGIGARALLQASGGRISIDSEAVPGRSTQGVADQSLVRIDSGAVLDVSGTLGVRKSVLDNFVTVELRGAELADSPQYHGAFYGKKLWVDIRDSGRFEDPLLQGVEWITGKPGQWQGTSLFNASGYIGAIQRGIGELTSRGGSIDIRGSGSLVLREGSVLDVSGGSLNFSGADVPVSYVIDEGGRYVPVGRAAFGNLYRGLGGQFTSSHPRWGVSETFASMVLGRTWRREAGYTEGQAAGTITLIAPRMAVEGDLLAINQGTTRRVEQSPVGGKLVIGDAAAPERTKVTMRDYGVNEVAVSGAKSALSDDAYLPDGLLPENHVTVLSADSLQAGGVGKLEIYANDTISVREDARVQLGDGGSALLRAADIHVDGAIRAPGGRIVLESMHDTYIAGTERGVHLGGTAVLDVAGRWTNWLADGTPPAPVHGGSIRVGGAGRSADSLAAVDGEIRFHGNKATIVIDDGALLDVSGGARVGLNGKISALGDAGSIEVAGLDLQIGKGAQLRGYALATSGKAGRAGRLSISGGRDNIAIGAALGELEALVDGVLEAGTPAPKEIRLIAPLVVPAGEPLPIDGGVVAKHVPPDTPVAKASSFNFYNAASPVTLQADWKLPDGMYAYNTSGGYLGGGTSIPAGTVIRQIGGTLQAGDKLPRAVFPDGITNNNDIALLVPAGAVLATDFTIPVGTVFAAGTVLRQNVEVKPAQMFSPEFFQQGGFGSYALTVGGDINVVPGTQIALRPQHRQLPGVVAGIRTDTALADLGPVTVLDPALRGTASLRLQSSYAAWKYDTLGNPTIDYTTGSLHLGTGSVIDVGVGGSIALQAARSLYADGTLNAPGGSIALLGRSGFWIGSNARLLVPGALLPSYSARRLTTGTLLPGGTVTLETGSGGLHGIGVGLGGPAQIVTEAGSLIDVSGALATLDLPSALSGSGFLHRLGTAPGAMRGTSTEVWSDGGSVLIRADEGAWLDGSYAAGVQHSKARAGSFLLDIGAWLPASVNMNGSWGAALEPFNDRSIVLRQAGKALPAGFTTASIARTGSSKRALLAADALHDAGFADIDLIAKTHILFDGDVDLHAGSTLRLDAAVLGTLDPAQASRVRVAAPYLALGDTQNRFSTYKAQAWTRFVTPQLGAGTLSAVGGQLLGLNGDAVLRGFGSSSLASEGDLVLGGIWGDDVGKLGAYRGRAANGQTVPNGGSLAAAGELALRGAQIYPVTATTFAVSAAAGLDAAGNAVAGRLTLLPGDARVAPPLEVHGSAIFQADEIVQGGVVRAPLGQITFDAGANGSVTFAPGSVTDVSLHGRLLPYGTLINGIWYLAGGTEYQPLGAETGMPAPMTLVDTPPAKYVTVQGRSVDIQAGAQIDLSGGGDLVSAEFLPGTGGSRNILLGSNVWAVVPGAQPAAAPAATSESRGPGVGSRVWLDAVPGLAAGWYTLRPADHALLSGAFRVQLSEAASDRSGAAGQRADGTWAVSGRFGSSFDGGEEARASTFLVMSGETVRRYSEFKEATISATFAAKAAAAGTVVPPLPADAGQLALTAHQALRLDGSFDLRAGPGGRGGIADIASQSIAVVADGSAAVAGYALTIGAGALNRIGAESLLLGGTRGAQVDADRDGTADSTALTGIAERILIANDADSALVGPEILLLTGSGQTTGTADITVTEGAVIRAEGRHSGAAQPWAIGVMPANATEAPKNLGTGQGALLVLSNAAGELGVRRFDLANAAGTFAGMIDVATGAQLRAENSILFDAAAGSRIAAGADLAARSLELASSTIHLGAAPAGSAGFVANDQTLAALARAERLVLRSYGTVDVHQNAAFTAPAATLVLDAAALRQQGTGDARIEAGTLVLRNTSATLATGAEPTDAEGTLVLNAGQLVLARGDSRLLGFGRAQLTAAETRFEDAGSLTAGGQQPAQATDVVLATPFVTAAAGADGTLAVTGALSVVRGDRVALADREARVGTGGLVALSGRSVDFATEVRLPAGGLTLEAVGDLTVGADGDLNVSGREQHFFDQTRVVPGGDIALVSQTGNVRVQSGARLNLQDPRGGGKLSVTVPAGSFSIEGQATGGSFVLDAGSLPGFGAMQQVLNAGGFATARQLRLRSGDALLDGVTKTRDFRLVVDKGGISVTGTIDASGATGGNIQLEAANDVVLRPGARLTVAGQNFDGSGQGGSVLLAAGAHRVVDGVDVTQKDAVVDIQTGSLIDLGVANAAAAAKVLSLDAVGSSVALAAPGVLGFPQGTPGSQIVATAASTITYADGRSAELPAGTPVELPSGSTLTLRAGGEVKVAGGSGKVAVVLPTRGAFGTQGATTLTSVPVTLNAPGSSIHLAGGTPVVLPNGTPGNDVISTDVDNVSVTTVTGGSRVTVTAGKSTLNLSAGAAMTVNSATGAWSLPVESAVLNQIDSYAWDGKSAQVTLTRTGSSVAGPQIILLNKSLPTATRLSFSGDTRALQDVVVPARGSLGVEFAVENFSPNNTYEWRVFYGDGIGPKNQYSFHFPEGTPAGVQLVTGTYGAAYDITYPDGRTRTTVQGERLSLPPGASLRLNSASGNDIAVAPGSTGVLKMELRNESAGSLNGAIFFGRNISVTQASAGTNLKPMAGGYGYGTNHLATYYGSQPIDLQLRTEYAAPLVLTSAVIGSLSAGAELSLPKGGRFVPQGSGDINLSLNGGGRFDIDGVSLRSLAAGSVLTLARSGRLDFVSGSSGAIPLLLSSQTVVAGLSGASLLDLGGGQAGTLHLRAPQKADGSDLGIRPIGGTVLGAARIVAEGWRAYDLADSGGLIDDAVKAQVQADGARFADHTAAIKGRLLATNPGLADVLAVTPGFDLVNSNAGAPASVPGALNPGGKLGLPSGSLITLIDGLTGGRIVTSSEASSKASYLELNAPTGGLRLNFNLGNWAVSVPAGTELFLPHGSEGRLVSVDGTAYLADGSMRPLTSAYYDAVELPPGTRVVTHRSTSFSVQSETATGAAALSAVEVVFPAGSYTLNTGGFDLLALPAGSTLRATGATASLMLTPGSAAPLALSLSTGGTYAVNGGQFEALPGQGSALILNRPGSDAVNVSPGARLTWGATGQVRASTAGKLYDAAGRVLRTFAAGDLVPVLKGQYLQLDAAGTVTTQTAALGVRVSNGRYGVTGPSFDQLVMTNGPGWWNYTPAALNLNAAAEVKLLGSEPRHFSSNIWGVQVVDAAGNVVETTAPSEWAPESPPENATFEVQPGWKVVMPREGRLLGSGGGETKFIVSLAHVNKPMADVLGYGAAVEHVVETTARFTPPTADVILDREWDLSNLRFGADRTPGILSLRAAGNVRIHASLSDGFTGGDTIASSNRLIDGPSWSYRFVGGADFAGAGVLGVQPQFQVPEGRGDVVLRAPDAGAGGTTAAHVLVRTGTGSIDLAAARDIRLDSLRTVGMVYSTSSLGSLFSYSALYTAGRPADIQPAASGGFDLLPDGRRTYAGDFVLALGGGDITLAAQRDVLGAPRDNTHFQSGVVAQYPEEWLRAQGNYNEVGGIYSQQVAWGPQFHKFREGVATLGGGNLSVTAGRDVTTLNAATSDAGVYQGTTPADRDLLAVGGGDLLLDAGRDINAVRAYVARGSGRIDAGRHLGTATARVYSVQTTGHDGVETESSLFGIGAAALDIAVRGNVSIDAIYNPLLLNNYKGDYGTANTYFSNYDEHSALRLSTLSGDIVLQPKSRSYAGEGVQIPNGPKIDFLNALLPGSTEVVAYSGDVSLGNFFLAPRPNGDLNLLSAGSVKLTGGLVVSDADPGLFAIPRQADPNTTITSPYVGLASALAEMIPGYWPGLDRSKTHAANLYRAGDVNPVRLYAVGGDVQGPGYALGQGTVWLPLAVPKPAEIRAGRDIVGLSLVGQNLREDQSTVLSAGRDIVLSSTRDFLGQTPLETGVWIGGPGRLEMLAGRNVNLGIGAGVQSVGNQLNANLAAGASADVLLAVGMGAHGPDYARFASAYLDPGSTSGRPSYATALRDFMRGQTGNDALGEASAWEGFQALPQGQRNAFIRKIYSTELKRSGRAAVDSKDYNDGYYATATLFPTDPALFPADRALTEGEEKSFSARWEQYRGLLPQYYGGNLSLRYSQVRSLYDGSIEMLVPYGAIDGGLARVGPDVNTTGQYSVTSYPTNPVYRDFRKSSSQLGVVALRGGDVDIMAYDDVIVNQSRIFAIGGGDLLIWSSEGDINAGKGAKTAVLAPPPRLVFDPASGGFSLELTGAATGSGIATLITEPGQQPGDVYLIAPHGTVDAGDAGIRVSGNLILAAQQVRGADNIEVEGFSYGLPQNVVNVGALTNASAAASQAATAAQDVIQRERVAARQALPSVFTVRVLGFGHEPTERGEPAPGRPLPAGSQSKVRYDPASLVQLVGRGQAFRGERMTDLTDDERRLLARDR